MSSCLLPTIQLLQPTTQNAVLRPKITSEKPHSCPPRQRKKKAYPPNPTHPRLARMRLGLVRKTAFLSLVGISTAQSSTWAQTQPFHVDASTESLLASSQQPLTNVVGASTPATTALPTPVPVSDQFSTSIPTELSAATSGSVVTVTPSGSAASASASSASASASSASSASSARASASSASASLSASASSAANLSASASASGTATQSAAAAAPVGVHGQQKMMGVAGALAGAAGVLFV